MRGRTLAICGIPFLADLCTNTTTTHDSNRADTLMRHWQRPLVTGSRRILLELCDWMPLD